MHCFTFKNLNIKAVYFFYADDQLVYIGRSNNLRNRLTHHFSPNTVDYADWKCTINKISYVECLTDTDTEILETYFINEHKPIYNKDKMFTDKSTFSFGDFEFKTIIPITIEDPEAQNLIVDLRLHKKINFKKICLSYIEAKQNNNYILVNLIEQFYPDIKEAYDKLGVDKMKALKYAQKLINFAINTNNEMLHNEQKIVKILDLKIGQLVNKLEIKQQLQGIYSMLGINKNAKAADLNQWYTIKDYNKKVDGKNTTLYKIINCNIKI